jgi:1,4-alpha-glucan branching enzyme
MKINHRHLYFLFLLLFAISCGEDPIVPPDVKPDPEPEQPVTIKEGLSWSPETPDADKELTIWFKAPANSQLYGHTGEVYVHIGVVSEGTWMYVPAEWEENIGKCKMTKVPDEPNTWRITLSPTIRQWFGSGETPVNKIGIVVRNADGEKKGFPEKENDNGDRYIENITDSKYKPFQPGAVKSGSMPAGLQHGINIVDNSTVTLVLYDKDKDGARKDFAHVVGDFNNWTLSNDEQSQMFRDDAAGCWWITFTGLDPTKEYAFQYYLGNSGKEPFRVADPYARKVLDPNNDQYISPSTYPENLTYPEGAIGMVSVFKIQEEEYHWKVTDFEKPSLDNLVIYELLLRDFTVSGDLNGAMAKLDYLQSLGVNAIELMPVQEFDGNDSWGYNPAFFFAMDKAYGTDRMYKEFIDECHKRGMAVILDVVYNHATGASPFARMWWNPDHKKPGTSEIVPSTAPNNPYFNADAPHPYSVFHDFNHASELVRTFVKRNLQFLLDEYHIDGFRFDLTKGFTQNTNGSPGNDNAAYDPSRIAILKEYNNAIKAVSPYALVILEHFAEASEENELGDAGMMVWHKLNHEYCQTAMGYRDGSDLSRDYYWGLTATTNIQVSYMESHDEERASYKQTSWGNTTINSSLTTRMSQLATNAAFFFTVPGPKMIWQFGELGYDYSIMSDPNGIVHDYENDEFKTAKKPIKWEYYDEPERKQLFDSYVSLIGLRRDHPELFNPTATLRWKVNTGFWESGRFLTLSSFGNAKQVVVVGNFTNNQIVASTTFTQTGLWYNFMSPSTTLFVPESTMNITVPANSFKIYTTFAP